MYTERQMMVMFAYGFMVTREGFNDECPYEHLSPNSLFCYDWRSTTVGERVDELLENPEVWKLCMEAMKRFE